MNRFNEILKEHGVSNYKELPEDMRKILEQAYPNECKYGVEYAEDFRKHEEVERINKRNEELKREEEEKRQRKKESEMREAYDVALKAAIQIATELSDLRAKYRDCLYLCAELSHDVNSKIVDSILKQQIVNDRYSADDIKKMIMDAFGQYEFAKKYEESRKYGKLFD